MRQLIWIFSQKNRGDYPTSFIYGHARSHVASMSLSRTFCDMLLTHGHFYFWWPCVIQSYTNASHFSNKSITLLLFMFHHWHTNQCEWNNPIFMQSIYSRQPRNFKKWWSWSLVISVNRPLYFETGMGSWNMVVGQVLIPHVGGDP